MQDGVAGDDTLNPGLPAQPAAKLRPAAVLVPLVERGAGLTVLLTRRTDHLTQHAGQIAFPGGAREPEDADDETAALREAAEEIGLSPDRVRLIGRLGPYVTRTGYRITPVVGLVRPPFVLTPDPHEVAEVFEVPLDFLVDPGSLQMHSYELEGHRRYFYALPWQDRYIWGATAGMLVNLARRLAPAGVPP